MGQRFFDAHSCLPLRPDSDLNQLRRHYDAGCRYVSINVGMDLNPLEQILRTLAGFRAQLAHSDFLQLVGTRAELAAAGAADRLAVSFDLEGSLPLLELPEMVALYARLGVRQIHLAYNRNNSIAGGAHDVPQGLTPLGVKVVEAIHAEHLLMDLSHGDEKTALDICAVSGSRPVLYSHGNPRALVPHGRNATDRAMRAVAATGGLVCLNGVGSFLGDPELKPASLVQHIDYVVQLLGIDHVGLGLDYCYDDGIDDMPPNLDRAYWWPPSAGYGVRGLSGRYLAPEALAEVWAGLGRRGYDSAALDRIAWQNLKGLLERVWL